MELLAPAGSFETLITAVQSGADAVYIGGEEFSARRSAANFSIDDIKKAADYCHLRDVKLHVAANILVKESEITRFLDYIRKLNEIGVDAVIIQDIGMANVVHKIFPDLQIHASTQMTISNIAGAKKMQEMGFSRVVLARELSKNAIEEICKAVDIETEVFCHGAICMCYSGQCLLSSMLGGRSGNRGMCAQPCRLPYEIDGESKYYLSPKDMSMIERISELKKIGVDSLKIEGRLKRKEYVSAVCAIYKKYIESGEKVSVADKNELLSAFNRSGFTSGYFDDKLGKAMMSLENPSNISENVFSNEAKARAEKNANIRKKGIYLSAKLKKDEPLSVSIWDDFGHFASVTGEQNAEMAQNVKLDCERLKAQLQKLGNTPFYAENCEIEMDDNITISIGEINAVRRRACEELERKILDLPKKRSYKYTESEMKKDAQSPILTAEILTYEQAKVAIEKGIKRIYADTKLANMLKEAFADVEIVAKLPPVSRDDRTYQTPNTDAVLISNIGQIDKSKTCYGEYRLNIFNRESVNFYSDLTGITLSPELNLKELSKIAKGSEVIGYGRIGLMVMENCPLKANGKCQNKTLQHSLKDRMKEKFPIICREGCVAELINAKPIYMADKISDLTKLGIGAIRLVFTVENSEICGKIVDEYKLALSGNRVNAPKENTFTRGHFYRGVE